MSLNTLQLQYESRTEHIYLTYNDDDNDEYEHMKINMSFFSFKHLYT